MKDYDVGKILSDIRTYRFDIWEAIIPVMTTVNEKIKRGDAELVNGTIINRK